MASVKRFFGLGPKPPAPAAPAVPNASKNLKNALTNYNKAIKGLKTKLINVNKLAGNNLTREFKSQFNTVINAPYAGNNSVDKVKVLQNRIKNGIIKYAKSVYGAEKAVEAAAAGAPQTPAVLALNRAAVNAANLSKILGEIFGAETNPFVKVNLYLSTRKNKLGNNKSKATPNSNNAKFLIEVEETLKKRALKQAIENTKSNLNRVNMAAIESRRETLANAISASGGRNKLNVNTRGAINNALKQLTIREQMIKFNSEQTPALVSLGKATNSNITKNAIIKVLQNRKSKTNNAQTKANINAGIALIRPPSN